VVQTLHNYRLLCPAGTFFRNSAICEECPEYSLLRGVQHGCYRDSRPATAVTALMLAFHRKWGTWTRTVDCYIAPTEFVRRKVVAAGLPPAKVFVKPNFVDPDPGERSSRGDYAVFVGRLSGEKGLRALIAAWASLGNRIPLIIVGDGPLRSELEREAMQRGLIHIKFEGYLPHEKTLTMMKGATFLIFPSEWYEALPLTIIEAFACGVPVICSRLGNMQELVSDGRTGLHFTSGDPEDLAAKAEWAWNHVAQMELMGREARSEYEAKYTPGRNYPMLMDIYKQALKTSSLN
jgi:glycosyltransferase involved in cell wall biosynthesis